MRFTALWIVASCMLAFASFTPHQAAAQAQPAAGSPDARELFRRGEAAYSAGNYELAIREWNNAYSVDPRPRIQFNLSQAYERMGQLENAMGALKKFLDSGDPDDPMYSDANARLSALQARLAQTGVVVVGGHEGGKILVDDKEWGRTPRPDKISVAPGSHVLVVQWTGRPEFRTNVQVPAGQTVEVSLPADAGAPAVSDQPVAKVDTSEGMSPIVWYSVGGALAAAGVGAIVYGAVRSGDAVDCAKPNSSGAYSGGTYCPDPDAADSASTQSMLGFVAGGVLVVGGGVLITLGILKARKETEPTAQLNARARLRAASTTCGVGFASATCRVHF
jgi:hypothetical protein